MKRQLKMEQMFHTDMALSGLMTTWYTDTKSSPVPFTYSHHFSECIAAAQHKLELLHITSLNALYLLASAHVRLKAETFGTAGEDRHVWRYHAAFISIPSSLFPH